MSAAPPPSALANLRDVAAQSNQVVSGVLLRSDAPLHGDQPPVVQGWPPATVLDLRDLAEKRERHPFQGCSNVVDLPLFRGAPAWSGYERWPDRLAEVYLRLLAQPLAANLVAAVTAVAQAEPPVLVHCTAGKDRTGVTIAVILRLIGVEANQIIADYALTESAMPSIRARMHASVSEMTDGARLAAMPPHILAAAPDEMAELLSALDAHEGGAVGWFIDNGGAREVVAQLRRRLCT